MIDGLPIGSGHSMLSVLQPAPGYLRCDGAAVSRTRYATLFALIGTTHGVGDGATTFNLPNLPDHPMMYRVIKAEIDPQALELQQRLREVAVRLRDPEQYVDACDEAADALENVAAWIMGTPASIAKPTTHH